MRAGELIVEAADESGEDFEGRVDIVVDIGVGGVEADDQQVVHSLVGEEEKLGKRHEAESAGRYVAILVNLPLNKLCWSSHLSIRIFRAILFSMEKEERKSTTLRAWASSSAADLNLLTEWEGSYVGWCRC